jgi:uncharacterized protein YbjQ (UPF0145 family)
MTYLTDRLDRADAEIQAGNVKKSFRALRDAFFNTHMATSAAELSRLVTLLEQVSNGTDPGLAKKAQELLPAAEERRDRFGQVVAVEPPPRWRIGMPVTTAPFIPGHEIAEYVGEVFGVIVRSRGALPALGAHLKSIVGGELGTMTNLLDSSRRDAVKRMVAEAEERGADAIISMRFDADSISDGWTEICAYGTAVRIHPTGDAPPATNEVSVATPQMD